MTQIAKYIKQGVYICYFPFLDKGEFKYRFYFHDVERNAIVNDINDRYSSFDEGVKVMCKKVKLYLKKNGKEEKLTC